MEVSVSMNAPFKFNFKPFGWLAFKRQQFSTKQYPTLLLLLGKR
jgi:microcystin-dependent protein